MPPRPALARLPDPLLRLASDQHGLLTTAQFMAEGLGRNEIRSLRRAGLLAPAITGVWSATPPDRLTTVRAARLAVGGGVACFATTAIVLTLPTPALAYGRSESPLETRVRLLLHDAGLGPDLVPQHEVRTPTGRGVARLDLAVPALRVGIECDGRDVHERPAALFRDRHRDDDLRSAGWRLVRVTGDDVRNRPADVVRRVRRALAQAS